MEELKISESYNSNEPTSTAQVREISNNSQQTQFKDNLTNAEAAINSAIKIEKPSEVKIATPSVMEQSQNLGLAKENNDYAKSNANTETAKNLDETKISVINNKEQINNSNLKVQEIADEISKLKSSAEIFGLTTRELEDEFIGYKVDKLMNKIDYLVDYGANELCIREKICEARKKGFGSITVFPTLIPTANRFIGQGKLKINSLISYPFGEDYSKSKIDSAKLISKTIASELATPVNQAMLGFARIRTTEKELKKMRKQTKGKQFKILINVSEFSQSGLVSVVKLCLETKINVICAVMSDNDVYALKSLMALCGSRISVEVMGNVSLKTVAITLNLGVRKISSANAPLLADELVARLKG